MGLFLDALKWYGASMLTTYTSATATRPPRHMGRLKKLVLAAAAVVMPIGVIGAAPAAVHASASGCTYGTYPVDRCVYVDGSGTWVNYIKGTIRYKPGLHLKIEVWGDGIYYIGYGNPYTPSDTTQVTIPVNRNLRDGSYVCVAARWTDGSQASPACVKIKKYPWSFTGAEETPVVVRGRSLQHQ